MTREQAERLYGPISVTRTANMTPHLGWDYSAVFAKMVDVDMPSWAEALGATEADALAELLEQAEEHAAEEGGLAQGMSDLAGVIDRILGFTPAEKERRHLDELYQNDWQRRSGC